MPTKVDDITDASMNDNTGLVAIPTTANPIIEHAARELANGLTTACSDTTFGVTPEREIEPDRPGPLIYLDIVGNSSIAHSVGLDDHPIDPEGFIFKTDQGDLGQPRAYLLGSDPKGLAYGVQRMLEQFGHGHYLSFHSPPDNQIPYEEIDLQLTDAPTTPRRLLFNWHNFLSGITAWDREHWMDWIRQGQRMGFNGIVVHAYANNPMAAYEYDDELAPTGTLTNSRRGREWGTQDVIDVRTLHGGTTFDNPVFGSEAALDGTDQERVDAARELAHEAFEFATDRGLDVYFAFDIDTPETNPPEIIESLPESARFEVGGHWLPRPDTPEGREFYAARVSALLETYPQIDTLLVWHRPSGSPWASLSLQYLPDEWQTEYQQALNGLEQEPENGPAAFAVGKIIHAVQSVVDHHDPTVTIGSGTWRTNWLAAKDAFFPEDVLLMPLDAEIQHNDSFFDDDNRQTLIATISDNRPVVPIAWAHHDDEHHYGRPYVPFEDFDNRLARMNTRQHGFGIIHWMTDPFDLFFASLIRQTRQSTRNQPLETTINDLARDIVGPEMAPDLAPVLEDWLHNAPQFGRETTDRFIDTELRDPDAVRVEANRREAAFTAILDELGPADPTEHLEFFTALESIFVEVHEAEARFQTAIAAKTDGDYPTARQALQPVDVETIIEDFATCAKLNGLTRGDEGLLVSLNTRWLPNYERIRQLLGIAPTRYSFGPTERDPLAQDRGHSTFAFDREQHIWQVCGTHELGYETLGTHTPSAELPPDEHVAETAIVSEDPIRFTVDPIHTGTYAGAPTFAPGTYELTLYFPENGPADGTDPTIELHFGTRAPSEPSHYVLDTPHDARLLRIEPALETDEATPAIRSIGGAGIAPEPESVIANEGTPGSVLDTTDKTAWTPSEDNPWIQLQLTETATRSELVIDWVDTLGDPETFDVSISDDGGEWSPVTLRPTPMPTGSVTKIDPIEITTQDPNRFRHEVTFEQPGALDLELRVDGARGHLAGLCLTPLQLVD